MGSDQNHPRSLAKRPICRFFGTGPCFKCWVSVRGSSAVTISCISDGLDLLTMSQLKEELVGDKGEVCAALRSEARRKVSLCNFRVGTSRGKKEGRPLLVSAFPLFPFPYRATPSVYHSRSLSGRARSSLLPRKITRPHELISPIVIFRACSPLSTVVVVES